MMGGKCSFQVFHSINWHPAGDCSKVVTSRSYLGISEHNLAPRIGRISLVSGVRREQDTLTSSLRK